MPHAIDFEAEIYTRQEGKGLLVGTYEKACVPWSPKSTPIDFGHELLAPDLERIAPSLELAFAHFPALERVGIKRVINGPFTFAPDGNPWSARSRACATSTRLRRHGRFSQGGGSG